MKFSNINPENKTLAEIREEAYDLGFKVGYEGGEADAYSEGAVRAAYEQAREETYQQGIDALMFALRNPITLDALVRAKDRVTVSAIIKRQAQEITKEDREE